jgi:hypothetical protein
MSSSLSDIVPLWYSAEAYLRTKYLHIKRQQQPKALLVLAGVKDCDRVEDAMRSRGGPIYGFRLLRYHPWTSDMVQYTQLYCTLQSYLLT